MSIMQLLHESRAMKDRTLFTLENSSLNCDVETMKQVINDKDVIINNNREKIHELENEISELREVCTKLEEPCIQQNEQTEMTSVIKNYEKFITQISASYEVVKEERNLASTHLANLEFSFNDLLQKYERLKTIVQGYQNNQDTLLSQIETYSSVIKVLQERYENIKGYANKKLDEANMYLAKNEKKHMSEMAKVQSKALQSEAKINELEKNISMLSLTNGKLLPEINRLLIPLPSNLPL